MFPTLNNRDAVNNLTAFQPFARYTGAGGLVT